MSNENGRTADVLVVDDEDDIRELIELSLLRMGLSCLGVATLAEAREALAQRRFRMCITDMRLPDGDGLSLVEHIQACHAGLPVAMMTAYGSMETAIRALKGGAFDFVTKPVELRTLRALVEQALKVREAQPGSQVDPASRLIGESAPICHLRTQLAKIARSQAPVFIHGESGTGKEVIARLIHDLGPRAGQPFVPVNCGAIATELVESELFGHRRGAFTGAQADKAGLFQAAHGGTLFLDEVADLPLPMQVKLLRAIQERSIRPVGASQEVAVDVRILSASHRNLAQWVAEGHFRQDLYFRINVIEVHVPPLRERLSDVPLLARALLARLAAREGSMAHSLDDGALAALCAHAFPGNVRELENMLERACALADGSVITADDLAILPGVAPEPPAACAGQEEAWPAPGGGLSGELSAAGEVCERTQVLRALEQTRWNRSAAARHLGMTLRQLRYRLQKWGLE